MNRSLTCERPRALARLLIALCAAALCLSCGDDGGSDGGAAQPTSAALFGAEISSIVLEVDYATGAAPYAGNIEVGPLWGFFGMHAERMFQASPTPKTITYPSELSEMEELTDVSGESFTVEAILAIADAHRDEVNTGSKATFYVIWLPGFYEDDSGVRDNVLGVSIGSTGVLAMFKPVIAGAQGPPVFAERANQFVEQSTLVHEFGHAVGMVNRDGGVPVQSDHHDEANGAHCDNPDCLMYFANEGAAELVDFVVRFLTTGEEIVFDDACLADMDAFASGQQ